MKRAGASLGLYFAVACAAPRTGNPPPTPALVGPVPWHWSPGIAVVDVAFGPRPCVLGRRGEIRCESSEGAWSDVPLPAPAVAISGAAAGTCALLADGRVHCWGCAAACAAPGAPPDESVTVDFGRLDPPPAPIASIGVNASSACATARDGEQICWGSPGCEQVGSEGYGYAATLVSRDLCNSGWTGNGLSRRSPWGGLARIVGSASADGHFIGLDRDGRVHPTYAAPPGPHARILDLAGAGPLTPTMGGLGFGRPDGLEAALENGHLCGAFENDEVRCWGESFFGAGTGSLRWSMPAVQVAVGERTACARLRDGSVRCWGHAIGSAAPLAMPLAGRAELVRVSPGARDTACAISGGAVACWGDRR